MSLPVGLIGLALCSAVPAQRAAPANARKVESRLAELCEAGVPNGYEGVILTAVGDRAPRVQALGTGKRSAKTPFAIGTLTEQFTAAAVLELAMQGKLKLTDPLPTHLPRAPSNFAKISILHLLTHTSGLPELELDASARGSRYAMLARVLGERSSFRPGRMRRDNPLDYVLLAAIVEFVTEQPFEEVVATELFALAKLRDTTFAEPSPGEYDWGTRGHLGVISSARDLHAWHRALLSDEVLDERHAELLLRPESGRDAFGWSIDRGDDVKLYHVSRRASFTWFRTAGLLIVALSDEATDLVPFTESLDGVVEAVSPESLALDRFVGRYRVKTAEEFEVIREGSWLVLRAMGQTTSARVHHGHPVNPEWPRFYEEVRDRAAVLFRPLLELDAESFARSFHEEAAPDAASSAIELVQKLVDRHGRAGRPRLIGTSAANGMHTWYRVPFGDESVILAIRWHGEEFDRVFAETTTFPFEVRLERGSKSEFTADSIDGKEKLVVKFAGPASGPARSMTLYDGSSSGRRGVRAKRMR